MKTDCQLFRTRLADALRGPLPAGQAPGPGAPAALIWHSHVTHCAACRDLLAEEEALDELLRSLPQPHLPQELAARVLSRLDSVRRGVDLDRLLELSITGPVPASLSQGVLERVRAEQRLDRLLDSVPAETVPADLGKQVLARLALARRSARIWTGTRAAIEPAQPARARSLGRSIPLRVAAGFALATFGAWAAWSVRRSWLDLPAPPAPVIAQDGPRESLAPDGGLEMPADPGVSGQPDELLLASLELFEAWDLLASADGTGGIDASLATFDSLDEYLLDFEGAATQTTEGAPSGAPPADAADPDPKSPRKNG